MRWLWLILLLVGALVGVGVWFLGPLIGLESESLRLVIALALLTPGLLLVLLRVLARFLRGRASTPRASAETVAALHKRMVRLVQVITASQVAKGKAEAIDRLPWVLVFGPTGSGKTTAIRRARLEIPFTTASDAGPGLEAYVTPHGVLFDTDGRTLAPDPSTAEHLEWLALLAEIRRLRPKAPIDAVLVVLDAGQVANATNEELAALAKKVRLAGHAGAEVLGWIVPTYVLFSGCDRLPGFVDSFAVLPSQERAQVLGAILEEGAKSARAAFDKLVFRVRALGHARLARLDPSLRGASFELPEQLATLTRPAEQLLQLLEEPSTLGERLRLRGAYFASAAQGAEPVDLLAPMLEATFGWGRSSVQRGGTTPEARSFFLHELFQKVLLTRQAGAARSIHGRRRRARSLFPTMGLLALVSLAGLFTSAVAFSRNRTLLKEVSEISRALAPARTDEPSEQLRWFLALANAGDLVAHLEEWRAKGPPLFSRFGFYAGDDVLPELRRIYERQMTAAFVDPASAEAEAALFDEHGSSEVSKDYDLLKAYLMVTEERTRMDVALAARVWLEQWTKQLHPAVAQRRELLQRLVSTHLTLVGQGHVRWRQKNDAAIAAARKTLITRGAEYQRMVRDYARDVPAIRLRDLVGVRQADVLNAGAEVDGLYTLKGWRQVRGHLGEAPEDVAPWVLEQFDDEDALAAKLREEYFAKFRDEWTRFLRSLTLIPSGTLTEARHVLAGLVEGDRLYRALLLAMKRELAFPTLAEDGRDVGADKAKGKTKKLLAKVEKLAPPHEPTDVETYFRPLFLLVEPEGPPDAPRPRPALDEYLDKIAQLHDEIAKFEESKDADLQKIQPFVEEAKSRADLLLRDLSPGLKVLMEPLLFDPLRGAADRALRERMRRMTTSFSASVCDVFYEGLAGRYPFAPSDREALLDLVTEMFAPGGLAWAFYDSVLAKDLVRVGERFEIKGTAQIPEDVVSFYEGAWLVQSALFPNAASELTREFQVVPQPIVTAARANLQVSAVTLQVGNDTRSYRFGPAETWTFGWPHKIGEPRATCPDGRPAARLILEGAAGLPALEACGDWALYQLVDRAAQVRPLEGGWFEVRWILAGGQIEVPIRVRTNGKLNPLFEHPKFRRVACQRSG